MNVHLASLKRIRAGLYRSLDGRYEVRNTYDLSGPWHVRDGSSPKWLLIDKHADKNIGRFCTLADAREKLGKLPGGVAIEDVDATATTPETLAAIK